MGEKKKDIVLQMNEYYAERAPFHDYYMSYRDNATMEAQLASVISYVEPFLADRDVLEIACGTGNWTQVLARRARSVLATDVNRSCLDIARKKKYESDRVTFRVCDAYRLDQLDGQYQAAFAADWWSHIPNSRIGGFLDGLHARLRPGAAVVFVDMMHRKELDFISTFIDDEGNRVSKRPLPDGRVCHVVKNFPTEEELRACLAGRSRKVHYHEDRKLLRWVVTYKVG
ncbi:MAG: methyltransferase domain-containing protein [candidate division Zixibacteria bacterium]|nr:methyltransferase domain-containing protein [candidate division Zixibacteria bacterium]